MIVLKDMTWCIQVRFYKLLLIGDASNFDESKNINFSDWFLRKTIHSTFFLSERCNNNIRKMITFQKVQQLHNYEAVLVPYLSEMFLFFYIVLDI